MLLACWDKLAKHEVPGFAVLSECEDCWAIESRQIFERGSSVTGTPAARATPSLMARDARRDAPCMQHLWQKPLF